MAALEQRPVSSVNGDVDVNLDVAGDMTEEDVVDEEDIQKEVRTIVLNVGLLTDRRRYHGAAASLSAVFLATADRLASCVGSWLRSGWMTKRCIVVPCCWDDFRLKHWSHNRGHNPED